MEDIKGYEGRYAVTKDGRIYSYYLKGFLSPKTDKDGYLVVCLHKNGQKKYFQVHRLIAETYISNPDNLETVNHKDGVKNNNNINNLEWCSFSDNLKHAYKIGLRCNKGTNSPTSKLTENDIRKIRKLLHEKETKEIAEMYGVVPGTIYNIASRRSWKHVI